MRLVPQGFSHYKHERYPESKSNCDSDHSRTIWITKIYRPDFAVRRPREPKSYKLIIDPLIRPELMIYGVAKKPLEEGGTTFP